MDLSGLTKNEWRHLRSEQLAALRSKDPRVRQDAVRNIIYLTRFHGDQVDFKRASLPLLDIYIFDRDEGNRIVALAGLHAVGSRNVMAHLAQRVRLESSPRVRRLTIAALADYYHNRDHHSDREAVVTARQLAEVTEE